MRRAMTPPQADRADGHKREERVGNEYVDADQEVKVAGKCHGCRRAAKQSNRKPGRLPSLVNVRERPEKDTLLRHRKKAS